MSKFLNKFRDLGELTGTTASDAIELDLQLGYSLQIAAVVETNANKVISAVSAAADTVTIVGHEYPLGLKVQLTTTGTLPAGLTVTTDFFLIIVDVDTLSFATTLANALAGTAVDITDAGTGTHTVEPVALAGGAWKIQGTNIPVDNPTSRVWVDIPGETANITVTANFLQLKDISHLRAIRLSAVVTAGSVSVSAWVNSKG